MAAAVEQRYTDIEIQPLTRDSQCGFCCLKLIEIEEPRVLPCGHIQCTQCIVVDSQNPEIVCKVCRKEFTDIKIPSLPEVPQEMINETLVPVSHRCDLCEGGPVKAVRFCADCKKKLCGTHAAEHEIHVSTHDQLLLEDGLVPERYEVQRCDNGRHKNHVLNEICKHCMKLFCKRCDTRGPCHDAAGNGDAVSSTETLNLVQTRLEVADCPSKECGEKVLRNKKGEFPKQCQWCREDLSSLSSESPAKFQDQVSDQRAHYVVPLREVTDELREKMRSLSQQLYDKMKRCRDLEKTTWGRLSDLEDYVQRLCNTVDNITDEMITGIKKLRDDVKSELQTYVTDATDEIEKYSEEILIGITVLDDQFRYGQDLADRRPDRTLLEEFNETECQLSKAADDTTLERLLPLKRPYLMTGTPLVDICLKTVSEPTGLEFVSKHETSDTCYGVSWTEDGSRVLCSIEGGVEVRGDDGKLITKVETVGCVFSAHLIEDKLYTQLSPTSIQKYTTYVGSLDEPLQTLLNEVEYEACGKVHHISVSHSVIAIVDKVNKELRVYMLTNDNSYRINLVGMKSPFGVEFLPADNSVLVTDYMGYELRKYRLEPADTEPVWTCTGLDAITGVTTDECGLIYASSMRGTIYLISPEGVKIKEFNHPMTKKMVENNEDGRIHDISVSDGRMVVACRGEGVMYFDIV